MGIYWRGICSINPVSYTHLDVYKRQYTLRIIDRSESKDIDDYFEDYDEDDFDFDEDGNEKSDADTPYVIPVDDTASEEEFNS